MPCPSRCSRLLAGAAAIKAVQPDVVLGMGGYISFPGGMMASWLRTPLVLHEQNPSPGLANRVLAGVADRIPSGFPGCSRGSIWAGNPVRPEIAAPPPRLSAMRHATVRSACSYSAAAWRASAESDDPAKGLARLPEDERPLVVHQSGEKHRRAAGQLFRCRCGRPIAWPSSRTWPGPTTGQISSSAAPGADRCRTGGGGVASVLVPFPHAVDDHQTGKCEVPGAGRRPSCCRNPN